MADEILVLEGDDDGSHYELLMLFPIAAPVQAGGTNVVPTPVPKDDDGLTPAYPFTLLTPTERAALDAGTLAYRLQRFGKVPGLTNPQLIELARSIYAAQATALAAAYAARYAHIGTRIDA